MSAAASSPLIATLVCVRRARGGARIDKMGVEVAGELRHYHPAGVLFALKLGAWRLFLGASDGPPRELEVAVDAYEREYLRVVGAQDSGEFGLAQAPACTHAHASVRVPAVG